MISSQVLRSDHPSSCC